MQQVKIGKKTSGSVAWLDAPAAASYLRMVGAGCPSGGITDAGRTNAEQWDMWRRYLAGLLAATAAYPGTSLHETGLALDLADDARAWMRAWGEPYGWIKDTVRNEPWHFTYVASRDTRDAQTVSNPVATTPTIPTAPTIAAPTLPAARLSTEEDDMIDAQTMLEIAYQQELGRAASDADLYPRLMRIIKADDRWAQLAAEIESIDKSTESNRYAVRQAYNDLLGRNGTAAEWDQWISSTGNDITKIRAGIAASAEAKAYAAKTAK